VLAGMILVGVGGHAFGGRAGMKLKRWIVAGCLASAVALASLALAARAGPGWPLAINVALLGFANGMFAVAAIGSMLELAGSTKPTRPRIPSSASRSARPLGPWPMAWCRPAPRRFVTP
jgi:BCD family chlorophyll transporter-like MFS transporter